MAQFAPLLEKTAASIDDLLGPAESRFFGYGYRNVDYQLSRLRVTGSKRRAAGLASVGVPARWSRKGTVDQRPHLSTIDMLVIGARLSELLVTTLFRFDPHSYRQICLAHIVIRAGLAPQESGLDLIEVDARLVECEELSGLKLRSKVLCRIGSMTVTCWLDHPTVPMTGDDSWLPVIVFGESVLKEVSCVGHSVQSLTSVAVDGQSAAATLELTHPISDALQESERREPGRSALSMVDIFVAGMQLGQVLMYRLDSLPRARSNTMWMRRTQIVAGRESVPAGQAKSITVLLEQPTLLLAGTTTWRVATIVTAVADWTMRCAVAHALPADVGRAHA